jgi:hypothetical protein
MNRIYHFNEEGRNGLASRCEHLEPISCKVTLPSPRETTLHKNAIIRSQPLAEGVPELLEESIPRLDWNLSDDDQDDEEDTDYE